MGERRCRYCQNLFQPSKYRAQQTVCGQLPCQRQRRADYHRQKLVRDAVYRQVCLDSSRKWRDQNPGYWQRYREKNPAAVERNLQRQRIRDQRRRLRDLANNNLAFDLKHSAAQVWLLGSSLEHLANNNSVPAQVWILETLPPRRGPVSESCQQHRSGFDAASA